jgi:hypothetical protein
MCPASDAPRFNHTQANRELVKALYTGSLKGLYQENADVVSDECFGDWMDDTWTTIWGLKKRAHEDSFWEIGMSEVIDVSNKLITDVYKLNDVCKFEKVGDDMKNFCLENPGQCRFLEGLEDRIFDSMFELMGVGFDFFRLFMKDDSCYSDQELMNEVYRASVDFGEISAYMYGVDVKWDQSIETKHIKRSVFKKKFHDEIKEYGHMTKLDKLGLMFPDFVDLFKGIEDFFKEIEKSTKALFKPHHKHHKSITHFDTPTAHTQTHHKSFDPLGSLFGSMFAPPHHQAHQEQTQQMPHHKAFNPLGDLMSKMFAPPKHLDHHNEQHQFMMNQMPQQVPVSNTWGQHVTIKPKQFNIFEQEPIPTFTRWLS